MASFNETDSLVVDANARRSVWAKPAIRRLNAGSAEVGDQMTPDGTVATS